MTSKTPPQKSWELVSIDDDDGLPFAIYRQAKETTAAMIADGLVESRNRPTLTLCLFDHNGKARALFWMGIHFARANALPATTRRDLAKQLAAQMELKTADELTRK